MRTALLASLLLVAVIDALLAQSTTQPRRWRLIVNDDGEIAPPTDTRSLQDTLNDRFNAVRGTQVDAYFLCIASTDRVVAKALARPQDAMSQWAKYGQVPEHVDQMIRAYIDTAHKTGIDIFLAARLNDIHDAWSAELTYPLKVERPDLLHAEKRSPPSDSLLAAHWSGFNWAEKEVRDHFLAFFKWACEKWDFDGLELDWFRHPLFFRFGEEQANIENINQWVRDVRAVLNEIGRKRGRPYLLTARPPDTPQIALRTGFDVEQWLKDGSLDMLMIGGGYLPYGGRLKEFIDMAHQYGIHAYPCQNHFIKAQPMQSIASGFFALGGDGFYMFNYGGVHPNIPGECLSQIGDPSTLAGIDKLFIANHTVRLPYIGHNNPKPQFPVPLVGGEEIEIIVGDNLAQVKQPLRATFTIKVHNLNNHTSLANVIEGTPSNEGIILQVNGTQLPKHSAQRIDADTFIADVAPEVLVDGINRVRVIPGPHCVGELSSAVTGLELLVDYDPEPRNPIQGTTKTFNRTLLEPTDAGVVSLYDVAVGTRQSIRFDIAAELDRFDKAQIAMTAEDFDSRDELTIKLNGGQSLYIPDDLLSDQSNRLGLMDIPLSTLKSGANELTFTFASNLGGTTSGFKVHEVLLVLTAK